MGGFAAKFRGFWSDWGVRRGDSAHGGQCRGGWAKNFLKKGVGKGEKPKNWGARRAKGGAGAPYIGCAG